MPNVFEYDNNIPNMQAGVRKKYLENMAYFLFWLILFGKSIILFDGRDELRGQTQVQPT